MLSPSDPPAHVRGTDPPAQTHISARCEHTGSESRGCLPALPLPPTSGALKGQGSPGRRAQAKWLWPPRAVCPTPFNEMDGGSHSRTACRAPPYLMQGCVCVCVWGRGKWGDTACTRAGMALRYFTHPLSERAFILHILSLWNLRLGEFNSHN